MLAFIPIILYLLILKMLDSFTVVKPRRVAIAIAFGILSCVITLGISEGINSLFQPNEQQEDGINYIFPILEEMVKGAFVLWMAQKRKTIFLAEAMTYGAAVGGGFALIENILYLYYNPDMPMLAAAFRGFGTALLHMGCTALIATAFVLHDTPASLPTNKEMTEGQRETAKGSLLYLKCGLVGTAILIHCLYNLFLINEILQLIITILLFLTIFVALSNYNENRIYQWLDHSITYDIQLLVAMQQGRLAETNTGKYLLSVKEQFKPEVFFDVICFMQLYLKLVVQGKSRMLLRQEGFAPDLTAGQIQEHKENIAELHILRQRIGLTGEYILRPVLRFNPEDVEVI